MKIRVALHSQHLIGQTGSSIGLIFAGYAPLASQSLYSIIVYFVAEFRPHFSHFWVNKSFLRFHLSHFLFMYLPYHSFK